MRAPPTSSANARTRTRDGSACDWDARARGRPQRYRARAHAALRSRKLGTIERVCGSFGNPEELAYGRCGEPVALYRVRFAQRELWPEDASHVDDTVDVELYEHWLVAVDP